MKKVVLWGCLLLGFTLTIGACSKQEEQVEQKTLVAGKTTEPVVMPTESVQKTLDGGQEIVKEKAAALQEQAVETAKEVGRQAAEKGEAMVREAVPEQYQGAVDTATQAGKSYLEHSPGTPVKTPQSLETETEKMPAIPKPPAMPTPPAIK